MKKQFLSASLLMLMCIGVLQSYGQSQDTLRTRRNRIQKVKDTRGEQLKEELQLGENFELRRVDNGPVSRSGEQEYFPAKVDKLGFTHESYQQYYKGIKVEYGVVKTHSKNGMVQSTTGKLSKSIKSRSIPKLSEEEALIKAKEFYQADRFEWEVIEGVEKPKGELIIVKDYQHNSDKYRLAYKFNIYSLEPIKRGYVYVDAVNGSILHYDAIIKHAVNDAHTHYHDEETRKISTREEEQDDGSFLYYLEDFTRGADIITKSLEGHDHHSYAVDITDEDNDWTDAHWTNEETQDYAALGAHWGVMKTYDYFKNVHGRDSYDDRGSALLNFVHVKENYENAFWNGYGMYYGDGHNKFSALTSLDVTAHELAHGVTSKTSGLKYEKESGALNEGFSDIIAACVEHHTISKTNPDKWKIGEAITKDGTYMRSLKDPTTKNHPGVYKGDYWVDIEDCIPQGDSKKPGYNDYCYVHKHSGVLNHWFYILSEGKSGVVNGGDNNGDAYDVEPITLEKAEKIVYRTVTHYLSPTSGFVDAREKSLQATIDIFGKDCEYESVVNAWHAVGLGEKFVDEGLSAEIFPSINRGCMSSDEFEFKTINSECITTADSWTWSFGEGASMASSTEVGPHKITYSTAGTKEITLTVTKDGETVSNTIEVFVKDCTPAVSPKSNWEFGAGVSLNFFKTVEQPEWGKEVKLSSQEGVVVQNDENGNFLFSSDGAFVYGHDGEPLSDALSQGKGFGSTSQLIVVPDPSKKDRYQLIYAIDGGSRDKFEYALFKTLIDATSSSTVIEEGNANIPVTSLNGHGETIHSWGEMITAIPHCSGVGYWIIIPSMTKIHSFLLNNNGDIEWKTSFTFNPSSDKGIIGQLKASPDGNMIAMARPSVDEADGYLKAFNFNTTTGQVTLKGDYLTEETFGGNFSYGCSFSENSSYLVGKRGHDIYRIDMTADNPTPEDIGDASYTHKNHEYNSFQLCPYGNIYFLGGQAAADADDPDIVSDAALYSITDVEGTPSVQEAVVDGERKAFQIAYKGLPNFMDAEPVEVTEQIYFPDVTLTSCDLGEGAGEFDLTTVGADIGSITITWYEDEDLQTQITENLATYSSIATTVYGDVQTTTCSFTFKAHLEVLSDDQVADANVYGCGDVINLSEYEDEIVAENSSLYTFTWYSDASTSTAISDPEAFTTSNSSETLYCLVDAGQCEYTSEVIITMTDVPLVENFELSKCVHKGKDFEINLDNYRSAVDRNEDQDIHTITWYEDDVEIAEPSEYSTNGNRIDFVVTNDVTGCSSEGHISVIQYEMPYVDPAVNKYLGEEGGLVVKCVEANNMATFNLLELEEGIVAPSGGVIFLEWFEDEALTIPIDDPEVLGAYETESTKVYCKVGNGMCFYIAEVELFVFELPALAVINRDVCEYDVDLAKINEKLLDVSSIEDFTFTWSLDEAGTNVISDPAGFTMSSDVQIVYCTIAYGECEEYTTTATFTKREDPVMTAHDAEVCKGSTVVLSASSDQDDIGEGVDYSWNPTYYLSNHNTSTPIAYGVSSRDYTVTGENEYGCKGEARMSLTVHEKPGLTIVGDKTYCVGETVAINAISDEVVKWTEGSNPDGSLLEYTATETIEWTATVTDENECSTSQTFSVTVNEVPSITVSDADITKCLDAITTQFGANGADTYSWSPVDGLDDASSATPTVTLVDAVSSYEVVGISQGCTSEVATVQLAVNTNPSLNVIGKRTYCEGEQVSLHAASPDKISWYSGNILHDETSISYTAAATQEWTVTASNRDTRCSTSETFNVVVNEVPTVSLASTEITACLDDITTQLEASGANEYLWSPAVGLDSETSATPTVTLAAAAPSYDVVGISNGCSSAVATVQLTVNANPALTIIGEKTYCEGDLVQLHASSPDMISWFSGNNLQNGTSLSYTADETKEWTVTASNRGTGCSTVETFEVEVNGGATPRNHSVVLECEERFPLTGLLKDYNGSMSRDQNLSYKWYSDADLTDETINYEILEAGTATYYCEITNGQGCSNVAILTFEASGTPPVNSNVPLFIGGDCETDPLEFNLTLWEKYIAPEGGGSFSWLDENGDVIPSPSSYLSSTQTVEATFIPSNGCPSTTVPVDLEVVIKPDVDEYITVEACTEEDGKGTFDLHEIGLSLYDGDRSVSIEMYENGSLTILCPQDPPIKRVESQIIYAKVIDNEYGCYSVVAIQLQAIDVLGAYVEVDEVCTNEPTIGLSEATLKATNGTVNVYATYWSAGLGSSNKATQLVDGLHYVVATANVDGDQCYSKAYFRVNANFNSCDDFPAILPVNETYWEVGEIVGGYEFTSETKTVFGNDVDGVDPNAGPRIIEAPNNELVEAYSAGYIVMHPGFETNINSAESEEHGAFLAMPRGCMDPCENIVSCVEPNLMKFEFEQLLGGGDNEHDPQYELPYIQMSFTILNTGSAELPSGTPYTVYKESVNGTPLYIGETDRPVAANNGVEDFLVMINKSNDLLTEIADDDVVILVINDNGGDNALEEYEWECNDEKAMDGDVYETVPPLCGDPVLSNFTFVQTSASEIRIRFSVYNSGTETLPGWVPYTIYKDHNFGQVLYNGYVGQSVAPNTTVHYDRTIDMNTTSELYSLVDGDVIRIYINDNTGNSFDPLYMNQCERGYANGQDIFEEFVEEIPCADPTVELFAFENFEDDATNVLLHLVVAKTGEGELPATTPYTLYKGTGSNGTKLLTGTIGGVINNNSRFVEIMTVIPKSSLDAEIGDGDDITVIINDHGGDDEDYSLFEHECDEVKAARTVPFEDCADAIVEYFTMKKMYNVENLPDGTVTYTYLNKIEIRFSIKNNGKGLLPAFTPFSIYKGDGIDGDWVLTDKLVLEVNPGKSQEYIRTDIPVPDNVALDDDVTFSLNDNAGNDQDYPEYDPSCGVSSTFTNVYRTSYWDDGNRFGQFNSIQELSNATRIYPNPSEGIFKVEMPVNVGRVEVVDMKGALVQSFDFDAMRFDVDLSDFESGRYAIRFITDDSVYMKHIVKM